MVWFEANMRPASALILLLTQYAHEKHLDNLDAWRLVMEMLGAQQPAQSPAPQRAQLASQIDCANSIRCSALLFVQVSGKTFEPEPRCWSRGRLALAGLL